MEKRGELSPRFRVINMKIIAFGEILWDVFGDEKTIGGAPFNFAAHIARLGAETYMISAVGNDELGKEALARAKELGIKTDHVAIDRAHRTGVCNVTLNNGVPSYDLVRDIAYDHIPACVPRGEFDALYMGTLALRGADSRRAFESALKYVSHREVFFDVNFRGSFYTRELVESLLRSTTVLKVSDEELPFFGRSALPETCLRLAEKYRALKYICVTLGKEGAAVYDCRNSTLMYSEVPQSKPVSTVGAGDSFSACFLYNLLAGEPVTVCLDRAVKLSDFVVTQLGAVPDYDPKELFNE